MKLSEIGKKYYLNQGLNCAQAVFLAVSEKYHLGYTINEAQVVAAFGGGMGCGYACGALTGGVAILGKIILKDDEKNSPKLKDVTVKFIDAFNEKFGSIDCRDITPIYKRDDNMRCVKTVIIACDILEEILKENV